MNRKIIKEFELLVACYNDKYKQIKNSENYYRLKQLKYILNILKKYNKKITIFNYKQLKLIKGIGEGTIERIKEILEFGYLKELKDYNLNSKKFKIIEDLKSVIGIGDSKALELYNNGITSVNLLKKKINNGSIIVNNKILIGLKYYDKIIKTIQHNIINNIYQLFTHIFININKKYNNDMKYIFEFCGSYRRKTQTSGDIDILISKLGIVKENFNYLDIIINILKKPIIFNNNKPFLIDDLTKKGSTKYMGFCCYNDYIMRVDIRYISYTSWYTALLYFTGSAEFNKQMRIKAKLKNYKLSEYGLYTKNNEKIPINSEKDIFNILNLDYIDPSLR